VAVIGGLSEQMLVYAADAIPPGPAYGSAFGLRRAPLMVGWVDIDDASLVGTMIPAPTKVVGDHTRAGEQRSDRRADR
jgi:hypothetical protein